METIVSGSQDTGCPHFSIIIPVYNVNLKYLEVCMQSILQQTYGAFEVLLVDDGSRGECAQACDEYAQADSRVRVIHQANQGVSMARNNGIENAKGKWIMFVDADDWIAPDACEKLAAYLQDDGCDLLLFNRIKEYANKQVDCSQGFEHEKIYDFSDAETREMFCRYAMCAPRNGVRIYFCWDKVYRREFLLANKLTFPKGIVKSEDKLFVLSCIEKAGSLKYVEDAFYHYRMNEGSVCHRYSASADADRLAMSKLLCEIASRMDKTFGDLKNDKGYHVMMDDCMRFLFGIITDVLSLKYYHKDNPDWANRRRDAKAFLKKEPFRTSIQSVKYKKLPNWARIKKFLLTLGMTDLFIYIWSRNRRKRNETIEG
ncbi:MAG: glycosyltransferase [Ruminococcus sp.]|nr:glycosyltransferase [Ruminococcus sp.]